MNFDICKKCNNLRYLEKRYECKCDVLEYSFYKFNNLYCEKTFFNKFIPKKCPFYKKGEKIKRDKTLCDKCHNFLKENQRINCGRNQCWFYLKDIGRQKIKNCMFEFEQKIYDWNKK